MNLMMFRAKVKAGSAADAEAAVKTMFSAIDRAKPAGVHYVSCKLEDGESFVGFLALDDPENNPLPSIPEWVAFQERLNGWLAAPPAVERLEVVGSYGLF